MEGKVLHIVCMAALLLAVGCKPGVPGDVIQPDDMEDILYDYYVSQGMASVPGPGLGHEEYQRDLYFNAVLKKHRVTRAEFDSSLVYYYTRADYFVKIYKNVQERLSDEALSLGASEGEVERFTAQSLSSDTANVWEGVRSALLVPYAPYNRLQFVQKADTSYRKGDSFMLAFKSDFLYQSGSKDAMVYLSVRYDNDSIVSQTTHFSVNGNTQVRISPVNLKAKEVKGYIYLGIGSDKSPDLKMLFLSDLQLIKFRQQKKDENKAAADSSSVKTDTTRVIPDSVRRQQMHKFGVRPEPKHN